MTATTSSPSMVLWTSRACAIRSTSARFSRSRASARSSSSPRLVSMRSPRLPLSSSRWVVVTARSTPAADAHPVGHAVGRDRTAHAPVALHSGHGGGRLEVARHARRVVAPEEQPLAGERGERHDDVGLVLAAPPGELVLGLDARHHAEVGAALLDGGQVDRQVLAGAVGRHRVARLVDGDGVRCFSMYSTSSGGPSSLRCLAWMTSLQPMCSRRRGWR